MVQRFRHAPFRIGVLIAGLSGAVLVSASVGAYGLSSKTEVYLAQVLRKNTSAPPWIPTWTPSVVGHTQQSVTPVLIWSRHQYDLSFVVTSKPQTPLVQAATLGRKAQQAGFQARFGAAVVLPVAYSVTQYATRAVAHETLWHVPAAGIEPPAAFGPTKSVALSPTWVIQWHPKTGALTWREGDWTVEIGAQSGPPYRLTAYDETLARTIATALERYRLPPMPGVISVQNTDSGPEFDVQWQDGRTIIATDVKNYNGAIDFPKQAIQLVAPPFDSFDPTAHFVSAILPLSHSSVIAPPPPNPATYPAMIRQALAYLKSRTQIPVAGPTTLLAHTTGAWSAVVSTSAHGWSLDGYLTNKPYPLNQAKAIERRADLVNFEISPEFTVGVAKAVRRGRSPFATVFSAANALHLVNPYATITRQPAKPVALADGVSGTAFGQDALVLKRGHWTFVVWATGANDVPLADAMIRSPAFRALPPGTGVVIVLVGVHGISENLAWLDQSTLSTISTDGEPAASGLLLAQSWQSR
jgi:hypothetical protein